MEIQIFEFWDLKYFQKIQVNFEFYLEKIPENLEIVVLIKFKLI